MLEDLFNMRLARQHLREDRERELKEELKRLQNELYHFNREWEAEERRSSEASGPCFDIWVNVYDSAGNSWWYRP